MVWFSDRQVAVQSVPWGLLTGPGNKNNSFRSHLYVSRRELLRQIGIEPKVIPVDVDEAPKGGEPPADYVLRLARAKAEAARRLPPPMPPTPMPAMLSFSLAG